MEPSIISGASVVHSHMYKSWIRKNSELALDQVEKLCREALALGMKLSYYEDDNYFDIVVAYKESDLYRGIA